jgi:lipopolysaccharide transport system ATP-binding protein
MSSSDVALRIAGLSKSYTIRHQAEQHITLAEHALSRLRHPFHRAERETFWALKDIDLEVKRGEILGIIGRNGAGKSTLLKVLSRITPPTKGKVELFGRLGSLLEVGTGFHPELTGRENIFLNGTILGMKKAEIDRQFTEIVEFAGVERFLDTPVKRYSSGMYVRLAFAVAAHLDTEILVVDEVLAVGDQEFQERCLGKMGEAARSGRTVLLVSHNLHSVERLCRQVALMDAGSIRGVFEPQHALQEYASLRPGTSTQSLERRSGTGEARTVAVEALAGQFGSDESKAFLLTTKTKDASPQSYFISIHVTDSLGRVVLQLDSRLCGFWIHHDSAENVVTRVELRQPWLKPGRYSLDVFLCNAGVLDSFTTAIDFEVGPSLPYRFSASPDAYANGLVFADFDYERL